MPSYGSLHSPSIRKMNGGIDGKSRRNSKARSMSLSNVLGDPFALATVSIALLAWLISLIGSVIATAEKLSSDFPNYSWFALAYMFCCILGVFVVIASDNIQTYHIAIVGFLACGLVLTTSSINSLIYSSNGAREAVAAGHILLSMINIIWIFYFGSTPSAMPRAYLDSFALHKDRRTSHGGRAPVSDYGTVRPDTSISTNPMPQMYTSTQIGGLKSTTPIVPLSTNNLGPDQNAPQQRFGNNGPPLNNNFDPNSRMSLEPTVAEVGVPTEYPYRAKAIYSYEANPEDANEISFLKHEILEVSDVSGRWWQAKKKNGDTGIAPSNYLILL
ncbi:High osmolarity signaling protein sho1 [Golovinomyces cichoracearum]|uniref:High osmolarity signaling protein sho1 n=1 Tax=Golovinomyces cichoracearum TaxID=62708 RepID=A0A420IT47_9PEZI|nr:High osmolarity signaling protein sho1 [Golovinomyces cichoracearum]